MAEMIAQGRVSVARLIIIPSLIALAVTFLRLKRESFGAQRDGLNFRRLFYHSTIKESFACQRPPRRVSVN
jgi:hypothetical protein